MAKRDAIPGRKQEICLESVETLYSDGRWNGRPSIVLWKGMYYIVFRSANGHGSDDGIGKAVMLKSTDLKEWTASTAIDQPDVDVAEPLLLATEDRLFMYIVAEYPVTTSFMTYSDDGVTWAPPRPIYLDGYSFNTPVTHKGVHYAAADNGPSELLTSTNGFDWTKVSDIVESGTETALVFLKDDSLVAVIRQSIIAHAKPPYKEWNRYESIALDGPDAVLVGDTVLVAGRHHGQTALLKLDQNKLKLDILMNMPVHHIESFPKQSTAPALLDTVISSRAPHVWPFGDKAYPEFLVLDEHRALMAYYDGQAYEKAVPKQADIRLATITVS
jgi:hypothetical protein